MEEIKHVHNVKYDMKGNIFFNADDKPYKISTKDALELAYAIFDSMGHSYDELEQIEAELDED